MSVAWTKEQEKVIYLRGRNILVSAAAGSGKTAVLVERIITMLTDDENPVSVDSLLIVTFTEAAAAEMKERIRDAIEKKLEGHPDNEHLKQQATLIHSAQITTIHSFCLSVIRDHFYALPIDQGFRIGEEGELKLLKHDVIEQVLEEEYLEGKAEFLAFMDGYASGRSDKKMEALILKIYEFSRSYPDPENWLLSCAGEYRTADENELEESGYMRLVSVQVQRCMKDAVDMLEQGVAICREPDGPYMYEETLEQDKEVLEHLLQIKGYEQSYHAFGGIRWAKLKANRDETVAEEKAAMVKAIRESIKSAVKDIAGQFFYQDAAGAIQDMKIAGDAMQVLAALVLKFAEAYGEKKRSRNMIDFGDMEQYALKILTHRTGNAFVPSDIAAEYQKRYVEIMIDEYQDSNLIQEAILTSVSTVSEGKNNVFMVGDVKQSIYRFRLSRPELFMEKFYHYDTAESDCQRIDLHKNFRSRREVLNGVNYLFEQLMTSELGGIVYDDEAALYEGAQYSDNGDNNRTEVLLIDTDTTEANNTRNTISDRELEARAIAARIRELLRTQRVFDKRLGRYRNAGYSDIVILTRSNKGFSDVFSEVLNREGIPTYAGTTEGYFETQEVGILLDYMNVINNGKQDIPLAAVLTSCMCGLSDEELACIKNEYADIPFHEAVYRYEKEGKVIEVAKKIKKLSRQIKRFRECASYMSMHELIWRIMDETGYIDYMSALPGGEQRRANLEMLTEKAKAFETTSYKGLFHFIRYIAQLQKYDVDYGEAKLNDEESDTVRLMTIHKSKGLEFPIVIVAGMGKQFNMQDVRSSVVIHARLGVGLDAVDVEHMTKSPSLLKKVIQREEALDSLGEELRVLYVAFTRAKEKLIIIGAMGNIEKKMPYYHAMACRSETKLPFSVLSKAVTYWDWLLPALERKTVEVPIDVRMITSAELAVDKEIEAVTDRLTRGMLERWDAEKVNDEGLKEKIEEQFSYRYPYDNIRNQKLKFTVSELKKRAAEGEETAGEILYKDEDVVPLIPDFLKQEEQLTGASRGTAYHRLMELLDYSKEYEEGLLMSDIRIFVKEGKMTADMAEAICLRDVVHFLKSDIGFRMKIAAKAGKLYKEQPFVLGVDARELYPDDVSGELVLVQGIIDVYFEEEGLVVLDYKTDRVRSKEELAEKYHAQLDYYAKALEQLTGKVVKEKLIYSFTLHEKLVLI